MKNNPLEEKIIEIPTPISITFESRCYNCKRAFSSTDYIYNYCPYCGASTVSKKRYKEFLESIIKEDLNE